MLSFKPCIASAATVPPSAPDWLHEIKHDGYRIVALRNGERVRLISRRGQDWAWRVPMVTAAIKALPVRSCVIDGEVIACDGNGLADFELLRSRRHDDPAILCAFDLLERDGRDLRYGPIEERKADLAWLLASCRPAIALNRVFDEPGPVVFEHACRLGCEGIVSKRRGSRYAAGRSPNWLEVKNPAAPAARREREEAWGG